MVLGWQNAPKREWNGTQFVDMAPETWRFWDGTQFQVSAVQTYADIPAADTTPPVVAFTSPAAGSTISGTLHLTGTVTDGGAVAYVIISVGSVILGNALITGNNWAIDIATGGLPNGNITLTAEAADTVGNAASVPRGFLVNNVVSGGQDQTGPYVDPTLASSTATTIASGTLILPNDARLTYGGTDNMQDPGTFPTEWRSDFIKGTTSTISPYRVTFDYSAQVFELYLRAHMNSEEVRFSVNGKWKPQTSTVGYRTTLGSGVRGYIRVDFGSAALRTIGIDLRTWFSGIRVGNNASLTKSQVPTFKVVALGDSLTGGTNQGSGDTSAYCTAVSCYFPQTAQDLGWGKNAYNESIGGSGFTVGGDGGGGTAGRYLDRTPLAVNARNPNVVLLDAHVLNDYTAGRTATQCRDGLIAVLQSMRAALPNGNLVVALTPLPPAVVATAGSITVASALVKSYNDPMRVACATFGAYAIDPLTGIVYNTDGSVIGNPNGDRWQMPTGQTYPSTYMTSDGVHPTREGSYIIAAQMTAALRMILDQASWKGPRGEVNAPEDTSPPTVPTLSTPSITPTSLSFVWTLATDPSGVAGYNMYLAGVKQNPAPLTTPTFTKTGLTANTTYGPWQVTAVDNAQNESPRSNSITAKTDVAPVDSTPPSVPTGFDVVATNGGWVASWAASTDAESAISGYKVYDGTTPKPVTTLLTYTATGYPNGTPVSVSVAAVNGVGLESAKTTAKVVTPQASTTQPFQPTNVAAVAGHQQMRVTWDAPVGGSVPEHYNVYFSGQKVGEEKVTSGMWDQLPNGTAIAVQVAAVDANGNEGPKSATVTDTPYPPSALGAPVEVASFGPNGTHWPDRTPWLRDATVPTVIDVACSWPAIKTAVNGLTAAQVNAGVKIRVAPGELTGSGASSGSANPMANVGQKSWRKRVLIVPRDGRGTVTFNNSVALNKIFNCTFALFDMPQGQAFLFEGCSYSAYAWSSAGALRVTGLGGTNTSTGLASEVHTEGFDVVEVVLPYVVVGDSDPAAWGGGNPGPAGAAGGNSWMRNGRFIGGYHAPQYRPIGGFGHNDALQMYGGSGSLYWALELRDMALWGSTNCAFQLGGWPGNGAPGNSGDLIAGPIRYSTRQTHCLILNAGLGKQVRYPIDPATTEDPSGSACNGINRPPQHYSKDCIYAGGMYGTSGLTWTNVQGSRITAGPAPSTITGAWTIDAAINSWLVATWNRICPVPDVNRLNAIWGPNPPAATAPVIPAVGQTS